MCDTYQTCDTSNNKYIYIYYVTWLISVYLLSDVSHILCVSHIVRYVTHMRHHAISIFIYILRDVTYFYILIVRCVTYLICVTYRNICDTYKIHDKSYNKYIYIYILRDVTYFCIFIVKCVTHLICVTYRQMCDTYKIRYALHTSHIDMYKISDTSNNDWCICVTRLLSICEVPYFCIFIVKCVTYRICVTYLKDLTHLTANCRQGGTESWDYFWKVSI